MAQEFAGSLDGPRGLRPRTPAKRESDRYLLLECLREMSRAKVNREQATMTGVFSSSLLGSSHGRAASMLAWGRNQRDTHPSRVHSLRIIISRWGRKELSHYLLGARSSRRTH